VRGSSRGPQRNRRPATQELIRQRPLACAKTLRVAPNGSRHNQHRPTQPLLQTRRSTPQNRTMRVSLAVASAGRYLDSLRVFAATPGPQAIALTTTMPHDPVDFNSAPVLWLRRNRFVAQCAVRATVHTPIDCDAAARECHASAIRAAYIEARTSRGACAGSQSRSPLLARPRRRCKCPTHSR